MSKITDALNQIWYEQDGKQVKVGLTRNFLDTLDECWHILPANTRAIKAKSPLMTVETNDSLVSVLSPVSGNVVRWETRATNFPDQLTENDVIMVLSSEKQAEVAVDPGLVNLSQNEWPGTVRFTSTVAVLTPPTAPATRGRRPSDFNLEEPAQPIAAWQRQVLATMADRNALEAEATAQAWGTTLNEQQITPASARPTPF